MMGILMLPQDRFGNPHPVHQLQHPPGDLGFRQAAMVEPHRLGNLAAHGHGGVQSGHGVLKDHGKGAAAKPGHGPFAFFGQVLIPEENMPAGNAAPGGQEPLDALAEDAFPAAGLAHDGQGLPLGKREAHVPHRLHLPPRGIDGHAQVVDVQNFAHRGPPWDKIWDAPSISFVGAFCFTSQKAHKLSEGNAPLRQQKFS